MGSGLTKAKETVEVLSQQRHDFLNNLQVISGLLQLNKLEQAKEYIVRTANQVKEEGSLYHAQPQEVAAKLSSWRRSLEADGVAVSWELETDLSQWDGDPELLSDVLDAALQQLRLALEAAPPEQRWVRLRVQERESGYMVQFILPAGVASTAQLTSGQQEIMKAGKDKFPVAIWASGDGRQSGWALFLPVVNHVL